MIADIAQLVEQRFRKAEVVGPIPTIGSFKYPHLEMIKNQILQPDNSVKIAILVVFFMVLGIFS